MTACFWRNFRSAGGLPRPVEWRCCAFILSLVLSFAVHWAIADLVVGGPRPIGDKSKKPIGLMESSALVVSLPSMMERDRAVTTPISSAADPARPPQTAFAPREGLLALRENVYFRRRDLTVAPLMLGELKIEPPFVQDGYPVVKLKARIFLDETGRPERVLIEDMSASGNRVEPIAEAALKALEAARYIPGQIRGKTVKSQMLIGLEFAADKKVAD